MTEVHRSTDVQASRVAFVTGGGSGIGRATAEEFLRHGFATVIADVQQEAGRAAEEELSKLGDCTYVHCDVTDDEMVRRAVAETVQRYGGLDAAFNAAGTEGEQGKRTAEGSRDNWDRVIALNLTGVWTSMRYEIPEMLKRGGGAIVNCSSMAGTRGSMNFSAYVASKHGVAGLTKSSALEYGRDGISVNAVCPGPTDTPQFRRLPQARIEQVVETSPVGRYGSPGELAEVVVWLCSDAPSYLTGQIIGVDGGMTAR